MYPLVEHSLVVIEDQAFVLFEHPDGGAEGRECFAAPFLPPPLPDGIEMGVTDQVNGRFVHASLCRSNV